MNAAVAQKSHTVNSHVTSIIDGEGVKLGAKGTDIPVINPTNEETISQLREADAGEVDRAVKAARRAFDSGPWPHMDINDRKDILYSIRDHLRKHSEELAYLECLNVGLPLQSVRGLSLIHISEPTRPY